MTRRELFDMMGRLRKRCDFTFCGVSWTAPLTYWEIEGLLSVLGEISNELRAMLGRMEARDERL
jgi:hypothetical protein